MTARNFARSEPVAKPIQAVRNALSFENRTKQNAYKEHFIAYYNNASDYKNIQSINEYYTEISEI